MENNSRELRGRPVTQEEAATAVRRLINSHFHNPDSARVSIPARATDDDLVASDYVFESGERYAALRRDSVPRAVAEGLANAGKALLEGTPQEECTEDCDEENCPWKQMRAAIAAYERLGGVEEGNRG